MVNIGIELEKGQNADFIKSFSIRNNSFIRARAFLSSGTILGKNCIVGTGLVVKGTIPNFSIVVRKPGKVIGVTREFAEKI